MPHTDDDVFSVLSTVPLMQGLSARQLRKVAKRGKVVEHRAAHDVTEEGGSGVGFHLILDGGATVQVDNVVRRELRRGDYFGEITLIDGKPRTATVTAGQSGLTTWSINDLVFNALLDEEPSMARPLLKVLASRLREAEAHNP